MRKADEIKYYLLKSLPDGRDIIIPNFYMGVYEMDICLLRPSGYVYEYEIKISKSDFKADFEKGVKNTYGMPKHERMRTGKSACNRFYFVVTEGLVTVNEVPKYAGLIYYRDQYMYVVKNAPLLHKNKCARSMTEIAQLLSFRERNRYSHWRHEKENNLRLKAMLHEIRSELKKHDPTNLLIHQYIPS